MHFSAKLRPNMEDAALKTIFIMVKCELGQAYKVPTGAVENVGRVLEVNSNSRR